jgi:hypothetical protein
LKRGVEGRPSDSLMSLVWWRERNVVSRRETQGKGEHHILILWWKRIKIPSSFFILLR